MNFSVDTKLGALLANDKAKEVLIKHCTEALVTHPMIGMAKGMSFAKVAKLSGEIPDEIVQAVDADLKAL